jgi:sorbitol-specific phosphotransferase system component IIBC
MVSCTVGCEHGVYPKKNISNMKLAKMAQQHNSPFSQDLCTTDSNEIQWAKSNEEYQEFGINVYDNYDKMLARGTVGCEHGVYPKKNISNMKLAKMAQQHNSPFSYAVVPFLQASCC